MTGAPIFSLLGAADDYTGAAPCVSLAAEYAEAGAPIRTVKYAGAHHSFDATYAVTFLPKATTAPACGVVRWDIEPWTIHSELTGATLDPAKLNDFYKPCTKLGAHAGRNAGAHRGAQFRPAGVLRREVGRAGFGITTGTRLLRTFCKSISAIHCINNGLDKGY